MSDFALLCAYAGFLTMWTGIFAYGFDIELMEIFTWNK